MINSKHRENSQVLESVSEAAWDGRSRRQRDVFTYNYEVTSECINRFKLVH
jgi:hypothetical protein